MPEPRASGARFETVTQDASERIAQEIRLHVRRAGLVPGDRLGTEHDLAREFGVSRPTLREALRLLAGSHLIRVSQGRSGGVFVASTPNESVGRNLSESVAMLLATESVSLRQLLEARMFMEVPLAGMAAANAGDLEVAALDDAIAAAEGQHPADDAFRVADAEFHRILAAAAGNELLVAFTSWTLDVLQPSVVARIGDALDAGTILGQHRAILRAVERHRRESAERAMQLHLGHLLDVLDRLDGAG